MLENGVSTGSAIRCSLSKDMMQWTPKATVLKGRPHYWDELIGSGPPPIKTRHGWLHLYHGVWSMLQTLGVNSFPRNATLHRVAQAIAILVPLGFISLPIAILLGIGVRP